MVLAFVSYFVSVMEFGEIENYLRFKILQDEMISEYNNILRNTQNLVMSSLQVGGAAQNSKIPSYKDQIKSSLLLIESIQNQIRKEGGGSTANQGSIKMRSGEGEERVYDLEQAAQQVISKAFGLINEEGKILMEDSTVSFVVINLFNEFQKGLRGASNRFIEEIDKLLGQKEDKFMIILVIAILFICFGLLCLTPLLLKIDSDKEKILSFFLDISSKHVKSITTKCENFLTNLQVGDEDDLVSERSAIFSEDEDGEGVEVKKPKKKRRRKTKNSTKTQNKVLMGLAAAMAVLAVFFGVNFLMSGDLMAEVRPFIRETNLTSEAEGVFKFFLTTLG
jgi:hypothetical protein